MSDSLAGRSKTYTALQTGAAEMNNHKITTDSRPQSPPPSDELDEILKVSGCPFLVRKDLIQALNAYILAEVLKLIGENEDDNFSPIPGVGGFDIEKTAKNEFRAELREALIARFGPQGDTRKETV